MIAGARRGRRPLRTSPAKGRKAFGNRYLVPGAADVRAGQASSCARRPEIFLGDGHDVRSPLQRDRLAQCQIKVPKGLSAFGGERFGEGQSPSPTERRP